MTFVDNGYRSVRRTKETPRSSPTVAGHSRAARGPIALIFATESAEFALANAKTSE
jgi:hypothetical protein